jgi:exosome complex exonuclease RRP6
MMYYARSDTHYLLYIYDKIRNELVESSDSDKNLVTRVLERSRELSLSRHENPECNAETGEGSRGWFNFVLKNSQLGYKSDQFAIFRALWNWRDITARKEDENPNFVLSNNTLTEIVRVNPPDAKALHSLLPLNASLARSRVNEIWTQMQEEKARGGPSLLQFFSSRDPATLQSHSGVPRVTKAQNQALKPDANVTAEKLARSQLFGDVAVSSRWDETKESVDVKEDYFPFPWQRFIGDIADVVVEVEPQQEPVVATAQKEETTPAAEVDEDEEFTLRRGQKRKAEAVEKDESVSSEADSTFGGDEEMQDNNANDDAVIEIEDEDIPSRAAKKAKKLEKKKQREEARAAQEQQHLELRTKRQEEKLARNEQRKNQQRAKKEEPTKYQAVPFDYSKAASVLHAKRDETKESAQEAKKKAFDPYAKTGDDEIKPARKMPPIRGEKSATFKK